MTSIINARDLSTLELNQLGNNFDDIVHRDQDDIDAMNRSLATLGEELDDDIEAALRSEHVAG